MAQEAWITKVPGRCRLIRRHRPNEHADEHQKYDNCSNHPRERNRPPHQRAPLLALVLDHPDLHYLKESTLASPSRRTHVTR